MASDTHTPPTQEKLAYRVDEFVRVSGLSRTSIYKLMGEGKLRTVVVAGRRLIPAEDARRLFTGEAA